jgi:hypothetical protein
MKNSTSVNGAVKQPWQTSPTSHGFEVVVDEEKGTLALELPSGTKVALDYNQIRDMVLRLEARKAK